ncbi:AAA family ATPase [Roseofilum casamattae]|uniref:AAA family ATPase n=1 Tax=Roseofilum casamattae BLCC-M143 TaxID=3022442 RepID=A0ABT7C0B2_9CYAN|nr:AAA family ATPase [Roseofilum casamattae]MDJ1184888.1 AAA family ATPase [Roseofilum casamattae BLCC-M143]
MFSLPGYQTLEQIYESSNSEVYRAICEEGNQPVILKMLKEDYPTPSELTRYKQEYQLMRSLELPGIITAYDLRTYQNTLVIVLEDFGGQSLDKLYQQTQLSLSQFLLLFIKVSDNLGQLHAANVIHKDINPANIVFNPETEEVKLIDLGISTRLSKENPTLRNPNVLEGTLSYISPEQTGRMNRSLDYRSDFYSLGVSMYELLIGQRPFLAEDELELVYSQIAKQPEFPNTIPEMIREILATLMAKNAEDRYQSAWGLKFDLQCCLDRWQSHGKIERFTLGDRDISDKFQIPQKLYGRNEEIQALLDAFNRAGDRSEMMLIAGYSGIGKSALVQEIYKPITEKRGYFISGKFDQFQRNIPYSAIVAAFKSLTQQLLTEPTENLATWKDNLSSALGSNGQVIIDVIPELEAIVGKQPAVEELGPTEAQNRFKLVFQNFIRVCCTPEHPLVIFLDDLQWTDNATLKLIELMMKDKALQNLFLIGAYRDNEVNAAHPLMDLINDLQKKEIAIAQVTLSNLELEDISQLIADTVSCHRDRVKGLAELILSKTGGNPFFINQFSLNLYSENLIEFDYTARAWRWDLEQIHAQNITDNVVELTIGKLKKLDLAVQNVLKLAACIGASFDLQTLSIVAEEPADRLFDELIIAIESGFILSLSELNSDLLIQDYRFLHDRVQQAAYALIPEEDKQSIHLKIGQLLLKSYSAQEQDDRVFDIVSHLNIGFEKIEELDDRLQAIELNLKAAKKAKLATAYAGALEYLKTGISYLPENSWRDRYSLTFELYKERCEVEYLNRNFAASKELSTEILANTQSDLDRCEIYCILARQDTMSANYREAFAAGTKGLALFGIHFPDFDADDRELEAALQIELEKIETNLGDRTISSIKNIPESTDIQHRIILKLICYITPGTFLSKTKIWYIVVTKHVQLSLKYGVVVESTVGFASYAMILSTHQENYALSYEFGQLAIDLSDRFHHSGFKSQALHLFATYVSAWRKHLRETDYLDNEALASALESGDLPFAGYTVMMSGFHLFYQGKPLDEMEKTLKKYLFLTKDISNQVAIDLLRGNHLIVENLRGNTVDINSFHDSQTTDELYLQDCLDRNSYMGLCYYNIVKAQALYIYDRPTEALHHLLEAESQLPFISISIGVAQHNFYYSLTLLSLYSQVDSPTQQSYLQQVRTNQVRMKKWADNCPDNYLHKYWLVEAEISWKLGEILNAMDLYDRAIELAKEHHYLQEEALANQRAAQFYLHLQKPKIARTYLQETRYAYQNWGAIAKVEQLDREYREFLSLGSSSSTKSAVNTTRTLTGGKSGSSLDIATAIKANQAISGEIVLEKLLVSLMEIILQNAGAQMGYLILADGDRLTIEAAKPMESDEISVLQSLAIDCDNLLPQTLVNYVARTQESVVLNDASNEGNFINDDYIKQIQPKSILCVPLINQGKLVSLVYLENNLATEAFTDERVEIIQLLSGQAAIALENAYLYQTLEQKVEERTAELALANEEIGILNEKLQAENIRLSSELDVAKKLQEMVLPKEEELQTISGLDIAAYMEPADEVGGDYYDILRNGDRLTIGIGDVTGHGLESGVLMLMAQTAIRTLHNMEESNPVKFLDILNQTLYDNLQRMKCDKNMSLSILDYHDGTISLSGQHEETIIIRSNGKIEQIDTIDLGFPIGLDTEIAEFISSMNIQLDRDDIVVLYTDGITEAEDINGNFYGLDRLCRVVLECRDRNANEIRERVIADVQAFIAGQKVFDDITIAILKQR